MTTNMFFACKKEWLDFNIRPAIIKEFNVFCIALRMCYSYAEDQTGDFRATMATILDCLDKLALAEISAKAKCATPYISQDVRYVLAGLMWIKNLVSG
ncbi:uncharacterized protein LOC142571123 isoform X2 [Dermacentor variabilis]|uniref:uncharacterized protein LOC142571123 isoform X2 n=1 Tax=Dermacentor variabilis TaxID=34621 RepID=UPI003F5C176B